MWRFLFNMAAQKVVEYGCSDVRSTVDLAIEPYGCIVVKRVSDHPK
jgi:hypothetical protein